MHLEATQPSHCSHFALHTIAAALLHVLILARVGSPAVTYQIQEMRENVITVSFAGDVGCSAETRPVHFAFSSDPGIRYQVDVTVQAAHAQVAVPAAITPGTEGRVGGHYLQWISFDPRQALLPTGCGGFSGSLRLAFVGLQNTLDSRAAAIKGNILLLPFQKTLSKTAVVFPDLPFSTGLKIEVDKDGIYELSATMLQSLGVPITQISSRSYQLFCGNQEIPLYITNSYRPKLQSDDKILFFGKFLRGTSTWFTQFSYTNVYWLTWTPDATGERIAEVSGEIRRDQTLYADPHSQVPELLAREFRDTIHCEVDYEIRWLGSIEDPQEMSDVSAADSAIDNWYWGYIGTQDLSTFTFEIPSPSFTGGAARLRIGLMGLTSIEHNPLDHRISILLNGNAPNYRKTEAIAEWDGQQSFIFTSDSFPASLLKAGENELAFVTARRGFADRAALNWIKIEYFRNYQSDNDVLMFKSADSAGGNVVHYELNGFKNKSIELWDITRQRFFTRLSTQPGTGKSSRRFSLVFQDSATTKTEYIAATVSSRLSPSRIALDTIASPWDSLSNVDYLVVAPDSFRSDFGPLLAVHSSRGLKTAFVDIEDIYNRFSFGIRDPDAIAHFVRYLFSIAKAKMPRFLLLGGDSTHDLDKNNHRRNLVPVHLARVPGWGPASNDDHFVTVRGNDNFADMSVGRFPAGNRTQVRTMVQKTVRYITSPQRGFWRDNLLLVGGGKKTEHEFTLFNNEMTSEVIGPRMNILRLDADPESPWYQGYPASSKAMANHINAGVFLLNFNGHGGGNVWSDNRLFSYDDLGSLYNGQWGNGGKLPVVFSLTCLTGFFESVFYRSLGEEFVRENQNGAICFYGASAYTSRKGNHIMNRILLEYALNGRFETIGELLWFSEVTMLAQHGAQYLPLVRQYNLIGDPALPWQLTADSLHLSLQTRSSLSGDTLLVSGQCNPVAKGNVRLQVRDSDALWSQKIVPLSKSDFSEHFSLKAQTRTATGLVRAYAWNDSAEVRGWVPFSKDTLVIHELTISPPLPSFGDSITLSCKVVLPDSYPEPAVYCLYAIAAPQAPDAVYRGVPMRQDSSGRWQSTQKIHVAYPDDIAARLLVYFRATSSDMSKESSRFAFGIRGRPDLIFTNAKFDVNWERDSMRIGFEVLNAGNAPAPPFRSVLFWENGDTISTLVSGDSLDPAHTGSFSSAIPDTQGIVRFTAVLNADRRFEEVTESNNTGGGLLQVWYRNLFVPADTLHSPGKGVAISPATQLSGARKTFLFNQGSLTGSPLPTESQWIALSNEPAARFSIRSRPPLGKSDSLFVAFSADTAAKGGLPKSALQQAGKPAIMRYDSIIGSWICEQSAATPSDTVVHMTTARSGPFALAYLNDQRPPDIQVSVHGRELRFLDYAAKDKPFSIFMSDASGLIPQSVSILLNGKPLSSGQHSQLPRTGDLRNITLTAYPPPLQSVDSLTVSVTDFAGNTARTSFAYMPGENLSIRFLSCHPNPFGAQIDATGATIQTIRFAFLLTDVANEVNLMIYTTSGKKIRSWRFIDMIGYQEVAWDGRDARGSRIANGTYYTKLVARNDRKKVKKIIRIAKLEGY